MHGTAGGRSRGSSTVVVCGAGAAGLAAAVAAAREGAAVHLLEARPRVGGTVAHSLIHTLAGLYDSKQNLLNPGLVEELAGRLAKADDRVGQRRIGRTWVLDVCPRVYRRVVEQLLREEARIQLSAGSRLLEVHVAGRRAQQITFTSGQRTVRLCPDAVIDATGTAEVVRLVDPQLVSNEPRGAAGGLIFTMRGVPDGALVFPRGLALLRSLRSAADEGRLPQSCAHTWIDRGLEEDEVYVKLMVPLPEGWRGRQDEVAREALQIQSEVVSFLQGFLELRHATVDRTGCLGVRDGGRVAGEYTLTKADVQQGRKFPDAACRAAWPIEYWDADQGVSLEYLPEGSYYEIPLRALKVRGMENLWVAGKCLSADRYAQASARVVGTCWAMGEAAGKAAAGG